MSTEQNTDQHKETEETEETQEETRKVRYVEELANKDDYWLSLTDVARATRTSDSMVRRWVTSGRLACKKEGVGINQRTRMVRASDVKKIRAIIDPDAAITDDIRKMDLASIPKQQEQIMKQQEQVMQDHQNLTALLQTALTALNESAQKQAATQAALDTITRQHAKLQQDHQALLKRLMQAETEVASQAARVGIQTTMLEQIQASLSTVASRQDEQQAGLTTQAEQIQGVERNVDQAAEHVATQIHQVEADLQADREETKRLHTDLDARITDQADALGQLQASLNAVQSRQEDQQRQLGTQAKQIHQVEAGLQEETKRLHTDLNARIANQATTIEQVAASLSTIQTRQDEQQHQLGTLEQDQARDVADLHLQVQNTGEEISLKVSDLAVKAATVRATIAEMQQRTNSQEHRLTALQHELETEVQARKAQAAAEEKAQKKGKTASQGM